MDIETAPLPKKRWAEIKSRCAGKIASLVELLRGSISSGVMEIVTRKGEGLFPSPREIALSCSCPDWASMCKHVAATLCGVGARIDHRPELLFLLRGTDPTEMVEAAAGQTLTARKSRRRRGLASSELSSVFGIDIDTGLSLSGDTAPEPQQARKTKHVAQSGKTRPPKARKKATRTKRASRKTQ